MTLRVSGVTWMVVLDGLGYDFAAWEADGISRVASRWYLEMPGRHPPCYHHRGLVPGSWWPSQPSPMLYILLQSYIWLLSSLKTTIQVTPDTLQVMKNLQKHMVFNTFDRTLHFQQKSTRSTQSHTQGTSRFQKWSQVDPKILQI